MQIPAWFTNIIKNSNEFPHQLKVAIQKREAQPEFPKDLILIFGKNVLAFLNPHISQNLQLKIKHQKEFDKQQFENLVNKKLEGLIKNDSSLDLSDLYKVSLINTVTPEEMAINDLTNYLFTLEMPYHEAIRFGCHKIPLLSKQIDNHQNSLREDVQDIYQLIMEPSNATYGWQKERMIFKSAAIIGYGKAVTWEHLIVIFAACSTQGVSIQEKMEGQFYFAGMIPSPKTTQKVSISFHNFVADMTINTLFDPKNSLLPLKEQIQNLDIQKLQEAFSNFSINDEDFSIKFSSCFKAQQDAIFYNAYLHELMQSQNAFPFQKALSVLKELSKDSPNEIYAFLHSSLHYFYCLRRFDIEQQNKGFLFAAIHSLKEKKKYYEDEIEGNGISHLNSFITSSKNKYSLVDMGSIILKFAMSANLTWNDTIPFEHYFDCIPMIEEKLGVRFSAIQDLLPEEDLKAIFTNSFRRQEDARIYLDYLSQLLKEEKFPFEKGYEFLKQMSQDLPSEVHNFLSSCLQYAHCLKKFQVNKEDKALIFASIHATKEEKENYNDWLSENCAREPFPLNEFIAFSKERNLSLKDRGLIILRYLMTISTSSANIYLKFRMHIDYVKNIEQTFGIAIPNSIFVDLIYFQSFKNEFIENFNYLINIKKDILIVYPNAMSIPIDLFLDWGKKTHLFSVIEMNLSKRFFNQTQRFSLQESIVNLIFLVKLSTYPTSIVKLSPLILKNLDDKDLNIGKLTPTHSSTLDDPTYFWGPAHFGYWETDRCLPKVHVSILNSIIHPKSSCTFSLTIPFSEEKTWRPVLFNLLNSFIDTFAKESLSEEEEKEFAGLQEKYEIPETVFTNRENPSKIFDAVMEHSPFLKNIWEENKLHFGEDAEIVKQEIYQCLKLFKSRYRQSFYCALTPNQVMHTKDCYPYDLEREDNLYNYFAAEIRYPDEQIFSNNLNFGFISLLDTKKISIKISIPEKANSQVKVKMELKNESFPKKIEVIYPPFQNKEQFVRLMIWQYTLFENRY